MTITVSKGETAHRAERVHGSQSLIPPESTALDHPLSSSLSTRELHLQALGDISHSNRQRVSPNLHGPSQPPLSSPNIQPSWTTLPTPALLYHFALSAHNAASHHLQQAFVHATVSPDIDKESPVLPLYHSLRYRQSYYHDAGAFTKALGLQLIALDLLRAGLDIRTLSDTERLAFSVQFGIVGLKVLTLTRRSHPSKGKNSDPKTLIDLARLVGDLQTIIGQSSFIAQRQGSLSTARFNLELLNARLAFVQGKTNLAKRMIQQYLTNKIAPPSHRYALYLLHLEYVEPTGSTDFLSIIEEASLEAARNQHDQMVQLLAVIRARYIFVHRRWELVPHALEALSSAMGWTSQLDKPIVINDLGDNNAWCASVAAHVLIFRCLWEGRQGNDSTAKTLLRQVYALMDATTETGVFDTLRASGGIMTMTPPNILYMLTYLTTVVSRRDFTGSNASCKNLVHTIAFQQTENIARSEDMWDSGFSRDHGLFDSLDLQRQVMSIRAEIKIELATTLLFRSDFTGSYQLLLEIVDHTRRHDLFHPYSPQLCLLFGQHANLLGLDNLANKYYRACMGMINEGSELSLIAEICSIGSQNQLADSRGNLQLQHMVKVVSDKCKTSTSAMFCAAGYFMASLTDENRVRSKQNLSTAYEIAQRSNNNVLRLLIFAFTTSTHHYGGRDRIFRQLETGRELARLFGGKDRADDVGQVVLGIWFALRLKDHHRQEGDQESAAKAKSSVQVHKERLMEIRAQAYQLASGLKV